MTQRGNRRQTTFFAPQDYLTYLRIAAEEFRAAEVEIWAYCLMPNHVHLIATPSRVTVTLYEIDGNWGHTPISRSRTDHPTAQSAK